MLKKFKTFTNESHIPNVPDKEFFEKLIKNNPMLKTHDFFVFLYTEEGFKENEDGTYTKHLNIERMIRLDKNNFLNAGGLLLRARFTIQDLGFIWWPKDATELIEDKGSDEMELWLLDTIEKHMLKKTDPDREYSRKEYQRIHKELTKVGEKRGRVKKQTKKFKI